MSEIFGKKVDVRRKISDMAQFLRPPIVLLKEGTDQSQGIPQIISNINACQVIGDIVRTTLGPRGMDKLIHDGEDVTITNDGATVVKKLNIVHPAAKLMADISKAQDNEVGDGTTSVIIIAVEFLKQAKQFLEENLPPQIIIRGYRKASQLALKRLDELCIDLSSKPAAERREMLVRCAETSLSSKIISGNKKFFAEMAVAAVETLGEDCNVNMIGVKKVTGGSLSDSLLIDGVAFKKTFSYAGFEQQPKSFKNPKILLLSLELELKAEKDNAEIRISRPEEYQEIVDAEWRIIYEKLELIVASGAQIVLSRLPVGDLATQYFADRNIFCAGRVEEADLNRTRLASGGQIQTTVNGLTEEVLGTCGQFEELQLGSQRYNIFKECPNARTATIILRGGAQQFVDEADRSLHDAIMVVSRACRHQKIVGGGGAIEMELSKYLKEHARTIAGAEQMVIGAYAKAFEIIPSCLASNSGADATEILNQLRTDHYHGSEENGRWMGVDCFECKTTDTIKNFIWEPVVVRRNAITAATEAACLVLSVDETVRNPKSEQQQQQGRGGMMPRGGRGGRGGGMMRR